MIKVYFVKLLKKIKFLKYFNFIFTEKINGVKTKVPISNGEGLTNLMLKNDWLNILIITFLEGANSFVDVGANIGQTLLKLKTAYPDINYLGFEPNATCTSYTQKLIKINDFKNCKIINVALSNRMGILELNKTLITDSRASLIYHLRPNFFSEKEYIVAVEYDCFFLKEKIDFIKIDVEGAEYEVLSGMEKAIIQYRPIIACEVLDSHSSDVLDFTQKRAHLVCEMLIKWNYKIIQMQTTPNPPYLNSFKKNECIEISQWTIASNELNDYIFYPAEKEEEVVEKLKLLTLKILK